MPRSRLFGELVARECAFFASRTVTTMSEGGIKGRARKVTRHMHRDSVYAHVVDKRGGSVRVFRQRDELVASTNVNSSAKETGRGAGSGKWRYKLGQFVGRTRGGRCRASKRKRVNRRRTWRTGRARGELTEFLRDEIKDRCRTRRARQRLRRWRVDGVRAWR